MKLFRQVYKYLSVYGIEPHRKPFNSRNLLAILLFGMGTASNCVHFFCEVETFQQYAESIFVTISVMVATTNFIYIASKMRELYDCFKEPEKIVNDSEFEWFFHNFINIFWSGKFISRNQ